MLRDFLTNLDLMVLPVVATVLFLAFFLLVLVRVTRKTRASEYQRLSELPLGDDFQGSER